MKQLMRTFAAVFMFAGIFVGCLGVVLLVILMVHFPPLLIAVLIACWLLSRLQKAPQ